jgi:hypothetical protein
MLFSMFQMVLVVQVLVVVLDAVAMLVMGTIQMMTTMIMKISTMMMRKTICFGLESVIAINYYYARLEHLLCIIIIIFIRNHVWFHTIQE